MGPVGPCLFHSVAVSAFVQSLGALTIRTAPVWVRTQAWMVVPSWLANAAVVPRTATAVAALATATVARERRIRERGWKVMFAP